MTDASTEPRSSNRSTAVTASHQGSDIRRAAAALVSAAVVICALYYGREILIPLAIAFLITFALNPPVTWLVRRGLSRLIATSLVLVVLIIILAGLGAILGAQVRAMAVELPTYQFTILKKFRDLRDNVKAPGFLEGVLQTLQRVQKEAESTPKETDEKPIPQRVEVIPAQQTPLEQAATWLGRLLGPLTTAGIIFIFVLFALLDI